MTPPSGFKIRSQRLSCAASKVGVSPHREAKLSSQVAPKAPPPCVKNGAKNRFKNGIKKGCYDDGFLSVGMCGQEVKNEGFVWEGLLFFSRFREAQNVA